MIVGRPKCGVLDYDFKVIDYTSDTYLSLLFNCTEHPQLIQTDPRESAKKMQITLGHSYPILFSFGALKLLFTK